MSIKSVDNDELVDISFNKDEKSEDDAIQELTQLIFQGIEAVENLLFKEIKIDPTFELIKACKTGNLIDAQWAIEELKADLSAKDSLGRTPLHIAANYGNVAVINLLLGHGADLEAKTDEGHTALHLAVMGDHVEAVEYLLENNANINATNNFNDTPLHHAVFRDLADCVELLIEGGADLNAKNLEGETAFDLSLMKYFRKGMNAYIFRLMIENNVDFDEHRILPKLLGHALSLEGDYKYKDEVIPFEGMNPYFTYHYLESFIDDFFAQFKDLIKLDQNQIGQLQSALKKGALSKLAEPTEETASSIQKGNLVFISTGWKNHDVELCFVGGYLAISNRGQGSKNNTLDVFRIDPSKITIEMLKEIVRNSYQSFEEGRPYLYEKLPKQLGGVNDSICSEFASIAPAKQYVGNCAYQSVMGAVRFAWAMLQLDPLLQASQKSKSSPTQWISSIFQKSPYGSLINRSKDESKLLTYFAASRIFEIYHKEMDMDKNYVISDPSKKYIDKRAHYKDLRFERQKREVHEKWPHS